MKKIAISLGIIGVVAAIVIGATTAYFSDTETSTGNTFTAGTLDLIIDIDGQWHNPLDRPFFDEDDIKPGDGGEETISLHVDNDAWLCVEVDALFNDDNGCNEPERKVDTTCGDGEGELAENLNLLVWWDDGQTDGWQCSPQLGPKCNEDPYEGDNKYQEHWEVIYYDGPASGLASMPVGPYPLDASIDYYIGIAWEVPSTVRNIIQSDSFGGDIVFSATQKRNNESFQCD